MFKEVPAADLPAGIDDLFSRTKGGLFYKKMSGFLAHILARLRFVWTRDLETAAISSSTLYWNPDFFMSLDKDSRITVLAHELWHNGFMHGIRLGERCPDVWNIAGDFVINWVLKEAGYYMDGFPYLLDAKYAGLSTDEVYDLLNKPGGGGASGGQSPLGGDVLPGSGEADAADMVASIAGAMAANAMSGTAPGDMPGEITQVLDTFLHPKLPWHQLLFNFFNELTNDEYSFARPNRRYDDPILPGLTGRNGLEHLMYFVDISGSISDQQVLRMNSEVKFIQEELNPERLSLITFDTKIHDIYEFERDQPFEKIEITGRGGTDLVEVFHYARAHDPSAIVIFTDLCVGIPPNPGVPVIWVCVDNATATVPFGKLIHLSE